MDKIKRVAADQLPLIRILSVLFVSFGTGVAKSHYTSPIIFLTELDGPLIKYFTFLAFLPISNPRRASNRLRTVIVAIAAGSFARDDRRSRKASS